MSDDVLKLTKATKKIKNINILDNINMNIKKGQIYGLIGLNGAGKSSLLKIISGLYKLDSGSIEIFGEYEEEKIEEGRSRMGVVIENPALYENKTVYENMYINKIQKGIPGNDCIEKALKKVQLRNMNDKKVKFLSLGNKQRLYIAMALLGDPEFLILDEPINGLDPVGIIKLRELLKKINMEYGVTILISSHILGELYHIANYYGIIHNGELIEEISLEELKGRTKKFIHIKTGNSGKAAVVINKKLNSLNFDILPNNIIKLYDYIDETEKVTEILVKEGVTVKEIMPKGEDLEAYFSKVIGRFRNAEFIKG